VEALRLTPPGHQGQAKAAGGDAARIPERGGEHDDAAPAHLSFLVVVQALPSHVSLAQMCFGNKETFRETKH
jgi:hypothetical protein